jgi:hypothetical protein
MVSVRSRPGGDTRPGRGTLLAVNVGLPKDVDWHGRTVHTGIWKRPVAGPAWSAG